MNLTLQTKRLTIAPLAVDDVDLVIEVFTDPQVMRFSERPMTETEVVDGMKDCVKRGGNGWIGIWCISNRVTGEKLGTLALLPMPVEGNDTDFSLVVPGHMPNADIEVGYYLKRSAWGNGYATEACAELVQTVLQSAHLAEIVATFDLGNKASRSVLTKTGFIDHGTMRCYGTTGPNFRITVGDLPTSGPD